MLFNQLYVDLLLTCSVGNHTCNTSLKSDTMVGGKSDVRDV